MLEPAFSTKDATGSILVTVLGMVAEMELGAFLCAANENNWGSFNPNGRSIRLNTDLAKKPASAWNILWCMK